MPWWGLALIAVAVWVLSGVVVGLVMAAAIRLAEARRFAPKGDGDSPPASRVDNP